MLKIIFLILENLSHLLVFQMILSSHNDKYEQENMLFISIPETKHPKHNKFTITDSIYPKNV